MARALIWAGITQANSTGTLLIFHNKKVLCNKNITFVSEIKTINMTNRFLQVWKKEAFT